MSGEEGENWAENEFSGVDLGDERREKRLIAIATALANQSGDSFPMAMGNKAALQGAYRFFDNPANEHGEILAGHVQATYRRMREVKLVLAAQDTMYVDYSHHPATTGLGPTTSAKQQGLVVHSTVAITPDRLMMGVMQEQVWVRDAGSYAKLKDHKERDIKEKESNKWLLSLESVIEAKKANPDVQFVSVGDREADVYDLFVKERPEGVDLLVRAGNNRRIEGDEDGGQYLWDAMKAAPLAARMELHVPIKKKQPARIAEVEVRWKQLRLRPPKHRTSERLLPVTLWAVWVFEPCPPEGAEQIEWMLLTTVPVSSTEDALERVDWYACRWGIEVWHKALKSGCKIEDRQLGDVENLKRMLAVFSVIAWRIMYTTLLARSLPDAPCTLLFDEDEWQALYCTIHNTTILPDVVPTLREAVRMVGRLGGFLGRSGDGEPGIKSLWLGTRRLHDLTTMYRILRPPDQRAK